MSALGFIYDDCLTGNEKVSAVSLFGQHRSAQHEIFELDDELV